VTARIATATDRAATAAMLARAFADDPAMAFIFPDPADRARRLTRLFALLYDSDGRAGMRLLAGDGAAATLWRAPGYPHIGRVEMVRHALPMIGALGTAIGRAMAVGDAIDAHMPPGDFWYLHVAGCDPAMQGRGLGKAAIRAGIDRAAGRLPCYLETATERNLGLYTGLGFAVTGEYVVPRGGPRFWSMLRPPTA